MAVILSGDGGWAAGDNSGSSTRPASGSISPISSRRLPARETSPSCPELEKLRGMPLPCVQGGSERNWLCASLDPSLARVETHDGGHRISGTDGRAVVDLDPVGGSVPLMRRHRWRGLDFRRFPERGSKVAQARTP